MRIIAGLAKGRRLRTLRGAALRPTADRVRESVFGTLGERVRGARFLDLYAGSGAVGLEALSRGAAHATFVESHRPAARLIEENAERCGVRDRARVLSLPAIRALGLLARQGAEFDLVFVDPPYGAGEAARALEEIAGRPGLLAAGGMVMCQHSRREEMPESVGPLARMKRARFGETVVDFYERASRVEESSELPTQRRREE
jgi:16S rRNA (guanine(966)-N(2))-methyltransferase RsmD